MKTLAASLALWEGNLPVIDRFPSHRNSNVEQWWVSCSVSINNLSNKPAVELPGGHYDMCLITVIMSKHYDHYDRNTRGSIGTNVITSHIIDLFYSNPIDVIYIPEGNYHFAIWNSNLPTSFIIHINYLVQFDKKYIALSKSFRFTDLFTLCFQLGSNGFWYRVYRSHNSHDDVIKWKYFLRYWPLCGEVAGHRWIPLIMASDTELWYFLISTWIKGWVNNRDGGDWRRPRTP